MEEELLIRQNMKDINGADMRKHQNVLFLRKGVSTAYVREKYEKKDVKEWIESIPYSPKHRCYDWFNYPFWIKNDNGKYLLEGRPVRFSLEMDGIYFAKYKPCTIDMMYEETEELKKVFKFLMQGKCSIAVPKHDFFKKDAMFDNHHVKKRIIRGRVG